MRRYARSFTLLEVVLVILILAILAAAGVTFLASMGEEARASRILHTVDTLRDACQRYHYDTGFYAVESPGVNWPAVHGLTANDGRPGWSGPYINSLENSDNPYNDQMHVGNAIGFDLDGDGADDRQGSGNYVLYNGVPESAARLVNDDLDAGVGGDWMRTGKVQYVVWPGFPNGQLLIYLTGGS